MVKMLATLALALSLPVESYRLKSHAIIKNVVAVDGPSCECSATGVVDGVSTGKPGCAQHFGQRFGYICYVDNGAECAGARLSRRTQVYWRNCRGEHMIDEARGYLDEAMGELDVDNLRRTIQVARDRGVDAESITTAEARVQQQIMMIAARDELMEALEAFDVGRLRAALEAAEELELDEFLSEETLERSVQRFEYLQARTESEEALRAAIEETNLPHLQRKLRTAQTNHVSREAIELGQSRVAVLTLMMSDAVEELTAAMSTRDAARIADARNNAQRLHATNSMVVQQAQDRLAHLVMVEAATSELRSVMDDLSLHTLQRKLTRARELDSYPDVLSQGDTRVAELMHMNAEALNAVMAQTGGHDAAALMAAIAHAETLDTAGDHPDAMAAANTRLEALARKDVARARLQAAIQTVNLEELQVKLDTASDLGVDAAVLEQARQRISEIAQMRVDARVDLERKIGGDDLEVLRAALAEAERLSATDPVLAGRATDRIGVLTLRKEAKDNLLAAMAALDRQDLEAKIAVAHDLEVDEATLDEATARSRDLLHLMHSVERHLRRDIEGDDYEKLRDTMAEAASYNGAVTEEQMQQARTRLAALEEVYRRSQELINAFDTLSMGHIQHMLHRCREVGCDHHVLADGEAAASRLRNRMANAERNMIYLTDHGNDAQQLREAITEVRLLNAAAPFRIENAENKVRELER